MDKECEKIVIINRAVPGSGKTTISNCVVQHLQAAGIAVKVHSTDEFFMTGDGRYDFQIEKLAAFHAINLDNYIDSLKCNTPVVICDNINIAPWQTKPFTDAARAFGYRTVFLTFSPRELGMHIESQRVTPEKPDAHGVPEDVLVRFIEEYKIYSPLLDKSFPINQDIHIDYFWYSKNNARVASGQPSPYFDADKIIEIRPNQYHAMKVKIGQIIYDYLQRSGGGHP